MLVREDPPPPDYSDQMERDSRTGKLECLSLVWQEDDEEKPPEYKSLIFTGQSDALASYLSFSHSHHQPPGMLYGLENIMTRS